jgi:tight adherence protein B
MVTEALIVQIIVFAAVVTAVAVIAKILADTARASEERMNEMQEQAARSAVELSPMSRYVSKTRFLQLRIIFAVVPPLAVPAVFWFSSDINRAVPVVFAIVLSACGWMLPHFYFSMLLKRRFEMFEMDVLDLALGLDNALRAGMALPQALDKITGQMHGVMKEELEIVQREYRLGINLVHSLERLHRRMPSEDVRLLVSAIRITSDAGGSLSEVLKEMSAMIRGRREFQDRLKTLTAEGRFEAIAMSLAPLAAFVFMYLIQPELMRVLYTTTMGWCSLGAVAVLDVLGYVVIRKIVSIEV